MAELSFTRTDLIFPAECLLEMDPDPIPRYCLLRDGLRLDPADPRLIQAKEALHGSKCVRLLQENQLPDGTWGRFHSQDSTLKQPFPTTENAITQALACRLDQDSPLLQRTIAKLLEYIGGDSTWPDPAEKHDNPLAWGVWVRHFSAAVLAQIAPLHPCLDKYWHIWAETLQESFQSDCYDRKAEILALNRFLDCRMKDPVPFHRKYPLLILTATQNRLQKDLEQKVLGYLLDSPEGIYYVCSGPLSALPPINHRYYWNWMQGHRLLSRFPSWKERCAETAKWIWSQRGPNGLWDLGENISRRPFTPFPLSESWKRRENRLIDSSVEMLSLLNLCFQTLV